MEGGGALVLDIPQFVVDIKTLIYKHESGVKSEKLLCDQTVHSTLQLVFHFIILVVSQCTF